MCITHSFLFNFSTSIELKTGYRTIKLNVVKSLQHLLPDFKFHYIDKNNRYTGNKLIFVRGILFFKTQVNLPSKEFKSRKSLASACTNSLPGRLITYLLNRRIKHTGFLLRRNESIRMKRSYHYTCRCYKRLIM